MGKTPGTNFADNSTVTFTEDDLTNDMNVSQNTFLDVSDFLLD